MRIGLNAAFLGKAHNGISTYTRGLIKAFKDHGPNRGEDYVVSYRVNGGQPVQIAAGVPAFGAGVVFKGDAVPLIQSLPSEGELAVHLSPRVGTAQDGIFSLAGLETVRAKIATACKWPHAIAKPNNR